MKTGQFDELMRKKLESLPQKFTEQEIDKLHQHIVSHKKPFFRHFNGSGLIYTVLVATITGLIIWQLAKVNPETIVTPATPVVNISGSEASPLLPDTASYSPKSESGLAKKQLIPSNEKATETRNSNELNKKIQIQSPDTITKGKYIPVPVTVAEKFDSIPVKNTRFPHDKQTISLIFNDSTSFLNKESDANDSSHYQKIYMPKDVVEEKNIVSDPIVKVTNEKNPEKVNEEKSKEPKKQKTSGNNSEWDFATGMEGGIANGYFRGALSGELTFRSHWVFQTGFGIQKFDQEKFKDENAYDKHKSHHFKHEYNEHIDEHDSITQIKSNRYLLQIPVSFHYLFQLKNNYMLSAGIGTDLDVYNHLKIGYKRSSLSDSIGRKDQFTRTERAKLFNNLIFSAGLQKRWNWLTVGIQPFMAVRIQDVRYKDNKTYFGANIRLIYHFGESRKRK